MNRQMIPYSNKMMKPVNNFGVQQAPYMQNQPAMMQQQPYILIPNPYYQQAQQYAMPNQFMQPVVAQLGDLSNEEAQQIILDHFKNLPITTQTAIISEAITGNFDTMSIEVALATEKICKAGIFNKVQSTVNDNQWLFYVVLAFLLGLGAFAFFNKKPKGRR